MTASARFPQLKVVCSWCSAPVGELCTNPATGAVRRSATHDVRRIDWVIETATCPACTAAPNSRCFAVAGQMRIPLTTPHPERTTAADRAHTRTHNRTQPWPHQPRTAPTATTRSAGPAPRPAGTSPSTPTPTQPGTPRSGATGPARFGPAARPPNSR